MTLQPCVGGTQTAENKQLQRDSVQGCYNPDQHTCKRDLIVQSKSLADTWSWGGVGEGGYERCCNLAASSDFTQLLKFGHDAYCTGMRHLQEVVSVVNNHPPWEKCRCRDGHSDFNL